MVEREVPLPFTKDQIGIKQARKETLSLPIRCFEDLPDGAGFQTFSSWLLACSWYLSSRILRGGVFLFDSLGSVTSLSDSDPPKSSKSINMSNIFLIS